MKAEILTCRQTLSLLELNEVRHIPSFAQYQVKTAAMRLSHAVMDMATRVELPPDIEHGTQTIEYSVIVGDVGTQKAVDEAVEKRVQEVVKERLELCRRRAVADVQHWGSHYGDSFIRKDEAVRMINNAFGPST